MSKKQEPMDSGQEKKAAEEEKDKNKDTFEEPVQENFPEDLVAEAFGVSYTNLRVIDQAESSNTSSSSTHHIDQTLIAVPHVETAVSKWQRFKENYVAITNDMDTTEDLIYKSQSKEITKLYEKYKVGTRLSGGLQVGFGIGQLGLAATLVETGVGIVPASLLVARGADNFTVGAIKFSTGRNMPTVLHQAAVHGIGFSETATGWLEFGADLSPSLAPTIAKNVSHIVNKGMLRLYDLGRTKNLKWFEPQYVSTGGFRNELSLTATQKQEALEYAVSLGVPKEAIYFTDNSPTSYKILFGKKEILYIGTDVLPNTSKTSIANSRITMKGAIAHEIVGHRAAELANMTQSNAVLEEAQASIRAARFAEGLTDLERTILLRDGVERLRNAGYKVADVKHELWIHEAEPLKPQLTPK